MKLKARNLYAILVVLLFAGYYAFYQCHYSWIELPVVSHFELAVFADKYLTGTLKFSDLFWNYGEHGMLGTTLLCLLNVELFSFRTTFEIIVNMINVAIVGAVCIYLMSKSLPKDKGGIMYYLSVAVCGYFVFNVLQGGCSGMDMQVRLGFLFGVFALLAMQRLMDRGFEKWSVILFVLLSLLYINVFGSLYCMAATGTMLVAIVLRIIALRKWDHTYFLTIGMQVACWILYFYEYPGVLSIAGGSVSGATSVSNSLADELIYCFQSLCMYSGSFVLGYDSVMDGKIAVNSYLVIGFFVLLIVLWAAFRFFKNKQYQKSWIPLMLVGYSYAVFCMVLMGRHHGITWVTGTWYHVHTKTAMVGTIWMLAYDAMQNKRVYLYAITTVSYVVLLCSGLFGLSAMLEKAPYVKAWQQNRQQYVFVESIEDMPADHAGQTPLGSGRTKTMMGLELLRKHKLSVFSDPEKFPSPTYGIDPGEYRVINGMWDDGWSSAGAKIAVYTQQEDKVLLKGYYPFEITGNEVITITAGDLVTEYTITQPEIEIWVQVPQDQLVNLKVNCNFYKVNEPDVRQLAFLFQGIENYTEDLK